VFLTRNHLKQGGLVVTNRYCNYGQCDITILTRVSLGR